MLGELNRRLDALGLAIENLGDIDRQTLAGSISTGTHGTGARLRSISAQVEAVELVLADGSSLEIDDSDPAALAAARVGLGALGLIYAVTLRVVPAFTLTRLDSPKPLDETLARLDELNEANDHFEFYVFPHTEHRALPREPAHRRAAPPALAGRRSTPRRWCSRTGSGSCSCSPAGDFPRRCRGSRGWPRAASAARPRSTAATACSPPSAGSGSPRWSTGSRASTRAEAVRRVLELAARPEHRRRLPDRGPLRRRRRRDPERLARPRHLLHRRPPGPQARLGALLPRRRGDHASPTAAARTGASATSRPPRRWRRAIRAGTSSRRLRARLDPEGVFAQRLHRPGPRRRVGGLEERLALAAVGRRPRRRSASPSTR